MIMKVMTYFLEQIKIILGRRRFKAGVLSTVVLNSYLETTRKLEFGMINLHYRIRIAKKIYDRVTMTVYVKCVV